MATGEGLGTSAAYALDPEQTPHTYLELGALPTAVPCARLHVKHVLREGGSEEELIRLIRQNVQDKWEGHEINTSRFVKPQRTMHAIGG